MEWIVSAEGRISLRLKHKSFGRTYPHCFVLVHKSETKRWGLIRTITYSHLRVRKLCAHLK